MLRSCHSFGRLWLQTSEVPEPAQLQAKKRLRLNAKKGGSGSGAASKLAAAGGAGSASLVVMRIFCIALREPGVWCCLFCLVLWLLINWFAEVVHIHDRISIWSPKDLLRACCWSYCRLGLDIHYQIDLGRSACNLRCTGYLDTVPLYTVEEANFGHISQKNAN